MLDLLTVQNKKGSDMTNRDRVAFVVVPPGYASAEEFANDCGYELFAPAINPPVQDAELATIAELAEHSPSSTNMIAGWKLASIAQELLSRRAQLAEVAAWMREENRSEQNKPPVYEFAVGSDSPPGGGWVSLQRINISGATGITSEQHEANARLRSISTDLLASVKELREAAAAMMRVIANHVELISEMGAECQRAGIKDGFGKRAQEAIAEAESADWLEQQKRYFYRMCIGPSAPKSHAEVHSSELRDALWDLLNDCINFDGGKLTPVFMKRASDVLAKARALGTDGAKPGTERSGTPTPPAALVQS